jgi:dTMP kinase
MLVVFEGIDGSGKTTLSNRVVERLGARGISVKHLRAGGRFVSSVTESIRSLGRDARNLDLVPEAEFLLYVAREVQLIEEALKPALLAHDVVFADRFLYTAEVLARFGRRLAPTWTEPVLRAAGGGVSPDLVVLMDVEPSLARARRKSHKRAVRDQRPPSRRGLAGVGLQYRLREGYLALARQHSDRWVVIDNDQPLEQAVASVSDLIEHALAHGAKASLASFRAPVLPSPVPSARAAASPRSAADALRGFVAWLEQRAELEPRVAAHMLSGLAGDAVDGLRRALIERVPEAVLFGLSGLVDPVSWEIRERLKSAHPASVARTLQEIPNHDPRAAALRAELEPSASADVLASLSGLDDERAWQIRESWYERQQEAVVRSLVGLDGVRAWQLRERWLGAHLAALGSEYELARTASRSVAGVPGERAFEVREAAALAAPVAALSSIAGLSCERSFQWRERYLVRAPKPVMATLRGMRTARAWQMRVAVAADCKEALDSIVALGEPEAWSLRESYADVWPSTVVKSLGVLADSERGRALLERQLSAHGANVSLLKHASAIALGVHDMVSLDD